MIYGIHGMDVSDAVRAVKTAICIILIESEIRMDQRYIKQGRVSVIHYLKTETGFIK